jgi:hypothetical protein
MADHGKPEYATAAGNDYVEHERTYDNVIKLTTIGTLATIAAVVALAIGTVAGAYFWMVVGFAGIAVASGLSVFTPARPVVVFGGLIVFMLLVLALAS